MKVYDCFIFNDELDLLELRFRFLNDAVEKFVLVESERTISGEKKPLHFRDNKDRFARYADKIIHLVAPVNEMGTWDYEFYQRNYIKQGLTGCQEMDLVLISDVDEIVNLEKVLALPQLSLPALIEVPMFNYFFNVEVMVHWQKCLLATWEFLQDKDIGDRHRLYPQLAKHILSKTATGTGWHFSYVFGDEIEKYQKKIKDFTHQEFNTAYYLDPNRIRQCIDSQIDIYERPEMRLRVNNEYMAPLLPLIEELGLTRYIFKGSGNRSLSPARLWFIVHKKYYRRIKYRLQQVFSKKGSAIP
ncbi:MAG TPA: hypothetical protein VGO58_08775 [Chitinophagaceae bacterium]|jgi:beta-1,4-mannosyl-glycoprotein beta-1,4-N-acetylglucosaminyltransferase|nr:hypothetical protein [Chitinophagaceae bacterium]